MELENPYDHMIKILEDYQNAKDHHPISKEALTQAIETLLRNGEPKHIAEAIKKTERNQKTVLHKAVAEGHIHIFKDLLRSLAGIDDRNKVVTQQNPDRRSSISLFFRRPTLHTNLAHLAVRRELGHGGDVVKALFQESGLTYFEKVCLLRAEDERGRRPVHMVDGYGNPDKRIALQTELDNMESKAAEACEDNEDIVKKCLSDIEQIKSRLTDVYESPTANCKRYSHYRTASLNEINNTFVT